MISITKYIIESHSGFTNSDVTRGFGRWGGGLITFPLRAVPVVGPAIQAAGELGMGSITNSSNKTPINEKSMTNRIGAIANNGSFSNSTLLGSASGGMMGGILGGALGGPPGAAVGTVYGSALGGLPSSVVGSYQAADRLGYGPVGKAASTVFGPLVGIATPKRLKKEHQKKSNKKNKD